MAAVFAICLHVLAIHEKVPPSIVTTAAEARTAGISDVVIICLTRITFLPKRESLIHSSGSIDMIPVAVPYAPAAPTHNGVFGFDLVSDLRRTSN